MAAPLLESRHAHLLDRGVMTAHEWSGEPGAAACVLLHRVEWGRILPMIKARIAEDHSDRRRHPRLPVDVEAKVRELGASGVEARVLNISEQGFMAESEGRFEVGCRVWLMLPGRDRAKAVVKWTAGDKLGAEFAEPISIKGLNDC